MSNPNVTDLQEFAAKALELAHPSIAALIKQSEERNTLHVVILEPGVPYDPIVDRLPILREATFGDQNPDNWKRSFPTIARAKARVCWRTSMSSRTVGEQAPYLYKAGDTKWPGGVVCDGLIVAASGLDWQFDEACAHMVIALFWAQVRLARDQVMAEPDRLNF
jgi:hypothetical protein